MSYVSHCLKNMAYTTFQEVALDSTSGQYPLAVHTGIISVSNPVLTFLCLICDVIFSMFIQFGKIFHIPQKLSPRSVLFYLVV
jgi:hypothetical protein